MSEASDEMEDKINCEYTQNTHIHLVFASTHYQCKLIYLVFIFHFFFLFLCSVRSPSVSFFSPNYEGYKRKKGTEETITQRSIHITHISHRFNRFFSYSKMLLFFLFVRTSLLMHFKILNKYYFLRIRFCSFIRSWIHYMQ